MHGCKQLLATHPSFEVGFDRGVIGGNYPFGEASSLIDFIKVRKAFEFCSCFPSVFWQATSHCTPVLCLLICDVAALKWPPAFELIFKFKL